MVDTAPQVEPRAVGPRLIAILGPVQSGKTALLEGLLAVAGRTRREEPGLAEVEYLGDRIAFVDVPGSADFSAVLRVCDAAVVVCEADPRKAQPLRRILAELEALNVPRFLFLNKVDQACGGVREALAALQPASRTPLLLRQIPLWENGLATGFVDLALERAFVYREAARSAVVAAHDKSARYSMRERLADYDDELMEQVLDEIEPPRDPVFDDLARELREGRIVPLLMGSATEGHGVTRLLKALRREAPGVAATRARLGVAAEGPPLAEVFPSGKLHLARVLRGTFIDGDHARAEAGDTGLEPLAPVSPFAQDRDGRASKRMRPETSALSARSPNGQ